MKRNWRWFMVVWKGGLKLPLAKKKVLNLAEEYLPYHRPLHRTLVRFNSFLFHFNEHLVWTTILISHSHQVKYYISFSHPRFNSIPCFLLLQDTKCLSQSYQTSYFSSCLSQYIFCQDERMRNSCEFEFFLQFLSEWFIIFYVAIVYGVDCRKKLQSPPGSIFGHGTKSLKR